MMAHPDPSHLRNVAVLGHRGSGKTSLLKTMYGALTLGNGFGEVAGFDLRSITRRNIHLLRRKLGIVFQDFNLLTDRNVEENLRFVLRATGWEPRFESAEVFVIGHHESWWSKLSARRRQDLSLVGLAVLAAAASGGAGSVVRHAVRGRQVGAPGR